MAETASGIPSGGDVIIKFEKVVIPTECFSPPSPTNPVGPPRILLPTHKTQAIASPQYSSENHEDGSYGVGNVHLGERLLCQIVLENPNACQMSKVHLRLELQTSSTRCILLDKVLTWPDGTDLFPAQSQISIPIQQDIKETGVHVITASLTYHLEYAPSEDHLRTVQLAGSLSKSMRKFFKFTVVNPLQLKTKVNNLSGLCFEPEKFICNLSNDSDRRRSTIKPSDDDGNTNIGVQSIIINHLDPTSSNNMGNSHSGNMQTNHITTLLLVEALLMNTSTVPFYLDSIRFEPIEPYQAGTLEKLGDKEEPDEQVANLTTLFQGQSLSPTAPKGAAEYRYASGLAMGMESLQPKGLHQFIFCLFSTHLPHNSTAATTTEASLAGEAIPAGLGRLDIRWRTANGEIGRLQTGILTRKDASPDALVFKVERYPEQTKYGQPFTILFSLHNSTLRQMRSVKLSYPRAEDPRAIVLGHGSESVAVGKHPAGQKSRGGTIESGEKVLVEMSFVPVRKEGLHRVSGLWLEYEDESIRHCLLKEFVIFIDP